MSEQPQPVFSIERLYVKDLSLEVPHAPGIFLEREAPQVNFELKTTNEAVGEGLYEVIITVTVTAKIKEKVMFLVEVEQAGVFRIQHIPETDMSPALGIGCPNILFPYLRETVSNAVIRAGFPAVILNPVNFEVLYQQQQQNAKADSATQKP